MLHWAPIGPSRFRFRVQGLGFRVWAFVFCLPQNIQNGSPYAALIRRIVVSVCVCVCVRVYMCVCVCLCVCVFLCFLGGVLKQLVKKPQRV